MSGQSSPSTSRMKKNSKADMQGREEGGKDRRREDERKEGERKEGREEYKMQGS